MKKLYAHWCYSDNCGDALNPYLLHKLSGCKIVYCNYKNPNFIQELRYFIREITHLRIPNINKVIPPFFYRKKNVILAIGSILDRSLPNYHIWGAGYMNKFEHAKGGKIYAVRGYYSAKKLEHEGFPFCTTYGDPALLLPIIYNPHVEKKYQYGIIPHMKDYLTISKKYPKEKIINLINKNVEDVIFQILQCKYILSTSLHGIIIAHAYGIPALWIKNGDINTDGIKFYDYFSSVDIPKYTGNFNMDNFIDKSYEELPVSIKELMLPKKSISEIQKKLIRVCPFEILPSIKSKVENNI